MQQRDGKSVYFLKFKKKVFISLKIKKMEKVQENLECKFCWNIFLTFKTKSGCLPSEIKVIKSLNVFRNAHTRKNRFVTYEETTVLEIGTNTVECNSES